MKNIIVACLTVAAVSTCCPYAVFAEDNENTEVYVTISDENGELAVSQEKINVTDIDNNGKLTINDALYLAHEKDYKGGADAGYMSVPTGYGTSLEMLWGTENCEGFGYYINSESAFSLDDEIKNGDFVDAYVYTDSETFSDVYTFFENRLIECKSDENVGLKLLSAGFDENWQPITSPLADAVILVDGEETTYKTDENGVAEIAFSESGKHIISAKSDDMIIVPPVCEVNVESTEKSTNKSNEKGDLKRFLPIPILCVAACLILFIINVKKKKH